MSKTHKGIDPESIVLDGSGRFELNDAQLTTITGGMKKKGVIVISGGKCSTTSQPDCGGGIVVIRVSTCTCG